MQPVHKCSQDCETLHKEISKKIILILINSRLIPVNEISTISNKNNWFGLETPLGRWTEILQGHEEKIKAFLCGKESKEIKILIYLDNEEGAIGVENGENGKKGGCVRRCKVLLEIWTLKFNPKNVDDDGNEGEIRKLYKRTTLYIRSLFTISRLLPSYSLLQQKLPLRIEIEAEDNLNLAALSDSLIASDEGEGDNRTFEVVNSTSLSVLQTTHGDLEIGVQFKKLPGKFYAIIRSPAIRVPQQVIKAKDIQINSSPAGIGSGDWIDMTQQNMYTLRKPNSATTGQIKILTTAHKPGGGSSLATDTNMKKQQTSLTDFIKIFEKPPPPELVSAAPTSFPIPPAHLIEKLEMGRSKKILFDRWLEELEIEHESLISGGFDLINNME